MDSSQFSHRGHTLRAGRFSEPGRVYLLTAVTNGREPLFQNWQMARPLIMQMRRLHDAKALQSLAWVVMPDHFHWLLQVQGTPLDQLMRQLKSRSAIDINRQRKRSGRVWQKGFHDRALRSEREILPAARYVVANPLRAHLVEHIGDYPLWDACWL